MFVTGIVSTTLEEFSMNLVIPKSAVLWTGKRSVVYVKQAGSDEPVFRMREIEWGPVVGDNYVIVSGLAEGEELVANGTFSVDAAAQLAGKPSMMNPAGGVSPAGHDHSTMTGADDHGGDMSVTGKDKSTISAAETGPSANAGHIEFRVEGLCEMCKDRIETTAKSVHGVETAQWDMETKQLHLSYDKSHTDIDAVKKAIADAGHDNDKYRAPDKVYSALPECCHYRK
jgi:Cu(I)/Ag(I) efflux system membrane fusion protein